MSGGTHSEGHIQTMSAAGVPSLGPGYRLALLHRGHQRRASWLLWKEALPLKVQW